MTDITLPTDPVERAKTIDALKAKYEREVELNRLESSRLVAEWTAFLADEAEEKRQKDAAEQARFDQQWRDKEAAKAVAADVARAADEAIRMANDLEEKQLHAKRLAVDTRFRDEAARTGRPFDTAARDRILKVVEAGGEPTAPDFNYGFAGGVGHFGVESPRRGARGNH